MQTAPFLTRLFQLAATLALASGLSSSAGAAIWYVDDSAPGGGTGTSWSSPFNTFQAALTAAAASGDEIRVGGGTYRPAGPGGSRSATFAISKSVIIKGGYCGFGASSPDSLCGSLTIFSGDLNANDGVNFANNTDTDHRSISRSA